MLLLPEESTLATLDHLGIAKAPAKETYDTAFSPTPALFFKVQSLPEAILPAFK